MSGWPTGWTVEHVAETDSTNADLIDRAKGGAADGLVRITDHQRAGRGRQGRAWFDRPGASLLMSVLLRPSPVAVERGDIGLIPLVTGLAVRDGLVAIGVDDVGLKWPNDVLVPTDRGERKMVGILAEATTTDGGLAVVSGMGVNLDLGPVDERPKEVADVAADVREVLGHAPARDDVASEVLAALSHRLDQLDRARDEMLADYRRHCVSIGRRVQLDHPSGPIDGTIVSVADDGQMVLATDGGERSFSAGEVHHRRP